MKLKEKIMRCFTGKTREIQPVCVQHAAGKKKFPYGQIFVPGDTLPEPEIMETPLPAISDKNASFNGIVEYGGIRYRATSASSREFLRIYTTRTEYDIERYANEYYVGESRCYYLVNYVTKISKHHFIKRIFITGESRYFMQVIDHTGKGDIVPLEIGRVQEMIKDCENNGGTAERCGYPCYIVEKANDLDVKCISNNEVFDKCEILDQTLYNNVIPLY